MRPPRADVQPGRRLAAAARSNCSVADELSDNRLVRDRRIDATAPVMPTSGAIDVTTGNPPRDVDYGFPAVVEVVDPAPTVSCLPVSGSLFPWHDDGRVTACDASENHSSMSVRCQRHVRRARHLERRWGKPVATSGGNLQANPAGTSRSRSSCSRTASSRPMGRRPDRRDLRRSHGRERRAVAERRTGGRESRHRQDGRSGCYTATGGVRRAGRRVVPQSSSAVPPDERGRRQEPQGSTAGSECRSAPGARRRGTRGRAARPPSVARARTVGPRARRHGLERCPSIGA